MKVPAFVIVDPDSADPLAVVEVVDDIDADTLKQVAIETGAYASRLAGKAVQGYVIRVDVRGSNEAEQVQFYRIWPNSTLQQLSSKNFPDLEALRVARKLMLKSATNSIAPAEFPERTGRLSGKDSAGHRDHSESAVSTSGPGAGMYLPAIILILLIVADSIFTASQGSALLSLSQSVLAFGAAALFTLPSAIRYLRR